MKIQPLSPVDYINVTKGNSSLGDKVVFILHDWVFLPNMLAEFEDLPIKSKYAQRLLEKKSCWIET